MNYIFRVHSFHTDLLSYYLICIEYYCISIHKSSRMVPTFSYFLFEIRYIILNNPGPWNDRTLVRFLGTTIDHKKNVKHNSRQLGRQLHGLANFNFRARYVSVT